MTQDTNSVKSQKFLTKLKSNVKSTITICEYCNKQFSNKHNLLKHIKLNRCLSKNNHQINDSLILNEFKKEICDLKNIIKNKENDHQITSKLIEQQVQKQLQIQEEKFEKQIKELKNKPSNINQILQVVCLGNNDNYLDMLTDRFSNFDQAISYIKNCALS